MICGKKGHTQKLVGNTYQQHGFTLIELMVVIAVLAIIVGLGVPAFDSITLSSKLRSYSNSLIASAQLARSEAMKRNAVVGMCSSADGTSCASGGWQQGWIVYIDADNTVLFQQGAVSSGYRITGSVDDIDFLPSGVGGVQSTLTVCRAAPSSGSQERVVAISATGRANVLRTEAGTCP